MTDHITKAAQLTPIIEKVHGAHHPELTRVREITQQITAATDNAIMSDLYGELRTITNGFAIPEDACGTFAQTYEALEAAEQEFTASQA